MDGRHKESKSLSRRDFLHILGSAGIAVFAVACGATPTPEVKTVEKVVEKEVTKVVEKVVEKPVAQTVVVEKIVQATQVPSQGGTLTYAARLPVRALEFGNVNNYTEVAALFMLYDRLINVFSDLKPRPELGESWKVSTDGLKWTFKLRQGVKFHDGTPFTSQAVKALFDLLRNPDLKYGSTARFVELTSIETPDDSTVVLGTAKPFGPLENYIAHYTKVYPSPTALQKAGAKGIALNPVGSGPYKFESITPDVKLTLVRNEGWWGGRAPLDKVVFIGAPEASVRANLLRTGEADVAEDLPIEELQQLEQDPKIKVIRQKSLYVFGAGFRVDKKPFDDPRVRLAFNHAIDKEAMVKAVFGGAASVMNSPLADPIVGHKVVKVFEYNPEKAKQLLGDAGLRDSDGDGIVEFAGKPFKPVYIFPTTSLKATEVAEVLQAMLKKVGVDLQLRPMEQATWSSTIFAVRGTGEFDLFNASFNPSNGDASYQLNYYFRSNPDPTQKNPL